MVSGLSNTLIHHSPHVALIEPTLLEDQRALINERETAVN